MHTLIFLFSLLALSIFAEESPPQSLYPWVVYYGEKAHQEDFNPYKLIVLQKEYPSVQALVNENKEVLGYIDLGEVMESDPWFSTIKEKGLLIKKNPNWKGNWRVDIRDPFWKTLLLEKMIPALLAKGFTGFFLDDIDTIISLEQEDPKKYKGMKDAGIELVQAIRKEFPEKKIMVNRGYEILSKIGESIDYVLAEDLYTSYNFFTDEYFIRSKADFDWQLSRLLAIKKQFPKILLFSLDYWDPDDQEMYKKIYSIEKKLGLLPYISTIDLQEIISEPS